jgi:hypothetical protein
VGDTAEEVVVAVIVPVAEVDVVGVEEGLPVVVVEVEVEIFTGRGMRV